MATQKVDPKHPLFRKIVRSRFKAFLFGIPGLIWLLFLVFSLKLDLEAAMALTISCALLGSGLGYYLYSVDVEKDLKKELRLNASQKSALSKGD